MKYFLIANGLGLSLLGLVMFYYFRKTNMRSAQLGMILLIVGAAQIFWYFMWLR